MNDYQIPADVREAFLYLFDEADATDENIMDAYRGEYASDVDFAADLLESSGELDTIPARLRYYFDFEKYAHDLMIDDFIEHNNHYFYRNW